MDSRPKITIHLTNFDRFLEISGWLSLLASWIFVGANYASLPNIIPIHFNAAGEADGFGSRNYIFLLPVITSILFTGMTFLNKFPHFFNYPKAITTENAVRQYTLATQLIRWLKTSIVLMFGLIMFETVQLALKQGEGLGWWFLPLFLISVSGLPIYFVIRMVKQD